MKKFNWEEFKDENNNIVVHCKTEEEADDFCNQMHEHGLRWCTGQTYLEGTKYNGFKTKTCYSNSGRYCNKDYYIENDYKILEWSDYMKVGNKEFTKADLKDGMVIEYNDKTFGRRLVAGDYLIGGDGYSELNNYADNLINNNANLEIVKIYKIRYGGCFNDLMEDENLKLIWERKETKEMTGEEMKQKLEELTGEKIEIEPSREEMIGSIRIYCHNKHCNSCIIHSECSGCDIVCMTNEQLKECYRKVLKCAE